MSRSLVIRCLLSLHVCAAGVLPCRALEQLSTNFNGQALSVRVLAKKLASTDNRKVWLICDSDAEIGVRLDAARTLGNELKTADVRALYDFLKAHPDRSERNLAGLRFLKNEVFGTLIEQTVPPAGLAEAMAVVWADHEQDIVARDYAIQHMAVWYDDNPERKDSDRALIRDVLLRAAHEQSSLAGTALIGLHHVSAFDSDIKSRTVDDLAFQMAASISMPDTARITAVQICAQRRIVAATPVIEHILKDSQNPTLRLSAMSALNTLRGATGGYSDIEHGALSDFSARSRNQQRQDSTPF